MKSVVIRYFATINVDRWDIQQLKKPTELQLLFFNKDLEGIKYAK